MSNIKAENKKSTVAGKELDVELSPMQSTQLPTILKQEETQAGAQKESTQAASPTKILTLPLNGLQNQQHNQKTLEESLRNIASAFADIENKDADPALNKTKQEARTEEIY